MKHLSISQIITTALIFLCIGALAGCGAKSQAASISYEDLQAYTSEVAEISYPDSGIIALGEATHGNRDFTLLKRTVFQQLVENQNLRAFVIEGDFGGCRKVNEYLQTGQGSAEEAAAQIGFAIYRTEEMAEMLTWMREFNSSRAETDQIRFYGYDMQRYNHNKEQLNLLLAPAEPALAAKYQTVLAGFNDDTMFDLEEPVVKQAIADLEQLNEELSGQKDSIIAAADEKTYDLISEYAKCLLENSNLRFADDYGTLRDAYMAEHVSFVYEFEQKYYGSKAIFITGHNGHIGKTTATVGTAQVTGEILSEQYGEKYFAIGTEFNSSRFLAPDDSGERRQFELTNKGDSRLAVILNDAEQDTCYLDLDAADADSSLKEYVNKPQAMSSIGEYFSDLMAMTEKGYTQSLSPAQTYNGLIFVRSAEPSTMLE